ncbi:hypothetical protein STA3757_35170 [Stanieria sp. NIES-3757]|nr:hypothetical protein STA3757_35170 [Stanieria sp. NIES-3757]
MPAKLTAFQLDIPTTETQYNKNGDPSGEKDLTVDALKEEILVNSGEDTLLILPEAKRLTTSIRYWDEDGNLMSIKKAFSYVEVENVIKKVGEC